MKIQINSYPTHICKLIIRYYYHITIAPNSRACKGGKERGEVMGNYGGIRREKEWNANYVGMVQPSQKHVAPCVKRC